MAYLNPAQDFRSRATAIVGVTAVHAALGIGLLFGLSFTGVIQEKDVWDPFTVTPDPLPKPQPEQKQQQQQSKSVVTVPPRPYDLPTRTDETAVVDSTPDDATLYVDPGPTILPTVEPTVSSLFTPTRARPRNQPSSWLSADDYPRGPLVDEVEGVAGYRLIVGTNGKVSACDVTRSTGNAQLDAATCKYIARRARFEPATDETGAKVMGAYTGTVKWEIPD